MNVKICLIGLLSALSVLPPAARASVKQWDGSANGNWSGSANWTNNAVPVDGDDLVFPIGASNPTSTNNIANLHLNSITFSGSGYVLHGNAVTLTNGITSSVFSGNNTISFVVTNGAAQTNNCVRSAASLTFSNSIFLGIGQTFTITGAGDTFMHGVVSGASDLIKSGAGALTLSGANTYSGFTSLNAGVITVQNSSGLGSASTETDIAAGTTLQLQGNLTIAETFYLAGTLRNQSGSNLLTGHVTLSSPLSVLVETNSLLTFSNVLSGGDLTKDGPGTLRLAGTNDNTYSGSTIVNGGTLELSKSSGVMAVLGHLQVGNGTDPATVRCLANEQFANTATVSVTNAGTLDLNNQSGVIAGLSVVAGTVDMRATGLLRLDGDLTVSPSSLSKATITGGQLMFVGADHDITTAADTPSPDAEISSRISGAPNLTKLGLGELSLTSSNDFSGEMDVRAGTLTLANSFALGQINSGTLVINGAVLKLQNNIVVTNEGLTLFGGSLVSSGTNTWGGPVTLATNYTVFVATNDLLIVSGPIDGSGSLTKTGDGTLALSGGADNTYSGQTTVNQGTLVLNKTSPHRAIPGALVVGDNVGGTDTDVVRCDTSGQIDLDAVVTVNSSGELVLNGNVAEVVDALTGVGHVALLGSSANLHVGETALSTSSEFDGLITGTGGITKDGSGTFLLTANNTYSGQTFVDRGLLLVNGSQPASALSFLASGLGTLGGTGTVGIVSGAGTIAPGDSPGILNCSNVSLAPVGGLSVELNGTNAGVDYDQLNVAGSVDLGGCALNVALGFTPAVSNKFLIIANDGTDAIINTFAGLPEGASFLVNNTRFAVSYTNGTGNDVVLTVIPFVTGITRTWDGGGTNNFWSNATNWAGDVAAGPGDNLLFPAGQGRLTVTNDVAAATIFNAITFSGSNYVVHGNALTLYAGLTNNSAPLRTNTVNCPLTLASNQTFSVSNNTTLKVAGNISGSSGLTKTGGGTLVLSGTNTYISNTVVAAGTLLVNGAQSANPILLNGGTLGGVGSVGTITCGAGGTINPGATTASLVTGILYASNLMLNAATTLALDLNGATPGSEHDQLNVAGSVNLGGCTLSFSGTIGTNDGGTAFKIINNAGPNPVTGTFNGLPEGALFNVSGRQYQITYQGGDSNDVVLTITSFIPPSGVTEAWTGGAGADTNWSNGANWSDEVPQPGDDLVFLDGVGGRTNFNNLAADTTFNSITFGGTNYLLNGNQILLNAGITNTNAGTVTVALPLRLQADQTFSASPGAVNLTGAIDSNGKTLTLGGGGNTAVAGVISGTGGLTKVGSGALTLSAINNYFGPTRVEAGALFVRGGVVSSPITIVGGTLGGTGNVGSVTNIAGTFSPGATLGSPGAMLASVLSLGAASTFAVELNNDTAGSGFDQLQVVNDIILGGSALQVSRNFSPAVGTEFAIIIGNSTAPVVGTFAGLTNGATFPVAGQLFQITYNSPGAKVTLTRVASPPLQFSSITSLTNGFKQLQGSGLSNLTYTIQANSNLATTNWLSIGTASANGSGVFSFTDTSAPSFPIRFYRVLSP